MPATDPVHIDPIAAAAYLCKLPGMDTEAVRQAITQLVGFAARQGFGLASIHFQRRTGERLETWAELITSCRSEGVVNVLVPDPGHFHHDPVIAAFLREELAREIQGTVWCASEATTATAGAGASDH